MKAVLKLSALVLSVIFIIFGVACAQENSTRIIFVTGTPKIIKFQSTESAVCTIGASVSEGDRIVTSKDEAVDISFDSNDQNILRVEENSDMVVTKNAPAYLITVSSGSMIAKIKNLSGSSKFEIKTPTAISGARGTGWRTETDGSRSVFSAFENAIYVKGIDQAGNSMKDELVVEKGWQTIVDRFEKPERLTTLSDSDLKRWNGLERDIAARNIKESAEPARAKEGDLKANLADKASITAEKIDKMGKLDRMEARFGGGALPGRAGGGVTTNDYNPGPKEPPDDNPQDH